MNVNLIEGVHDKSERGLRTILRAQAKVRLYVAVPVILGDLVLFFTTPGGIPFWFICLTAGYCTYAAMPYWLIRRGSQSSLQWLLMATAISDPLVLSIWIALTGKFGSLLVGFYLFTTLGFGFRTGRPLMHLCQVASLIGFTLVLAVDHYWQRNIVVWIALLVPLMVVPMYAGVLIRTLRAAREHAEQESRSKSELLAKVSHELRTPLTGIVAAAELLTVESRDRVVLRRTETILTLSDNLLREINDLLDEAKYGAEALVLDRASVDLNHQITVLRTTFETMAVKKGIAFHADIDPDVVNRVETDAHHLNRILLNLIGNAIKFTEKGSVGVTVDLLRETSADYRLRFSVSDSGIGIPESFHAKMFQPFSQVDQGSHRRYGGTGLGLTLSKKIIESMGGTLQFESTLGKGSRFWFDLDLPRSSTESVQASVTVHAEITSPKRILVVEDNLTNLILIQELLKVDHHEVTSCTSGISALEALTKHDFDVLLLDYNLGDMDGVRVLQTYQFGRLHPAPALFLTADATAKTAARLKAAGGAGILYKPVNLASIRHALAQIQFPLDDVAPEPSVATAVAKPERPALKVVPASPIDHEVLDELKSVNDRPEFLAMLLSHADSDITRSCQQLLQAFADKSYAAVPNVAHALKGVSANVGAVRLAALASSLMNMSSDELESSQDRLVADVRDWSRTTVLALRKIVAELTPSSAGNTSLLHLD
ncbi:MAG: ATP-binding protein [Rudaea sp.]|nr:ATP-binding protein [Rudaea sp.]